MEEKIPVDCWGVHELEGVVFYLEPDTIDDELCPYGMIAGVGKCPHKGLSKETAVDWEKFAYVPDPSLRADKCLELIPEGLNIGNKYETFIHAKYLPPKKILLDLLKRTNALPLFIYGIDMNVNINDLLTLTQLPCPRPIYFSGDPFVPVPTFIKRL